jgi:membrane associated rhomboid family serine protease
MAPHAVKKEAKMPLEEPRHPMNESPVNPLPPVVVALFLVLAGVELVFNLGARGLVGGPGAIGWRIAAIQNYAFSGEIFDWMRETGRWMPEHLFRFLSYSFIHGSFSHALFGFVILLAMGKIVGEALGSIGVVVIFFGSAICGALAYAVLLDDPRPLMGAFPANYGLIGGFTYFLWLRLGQAGEAQIRAFSLIGFLLLVQLLFGVFFGGGNDWVADLAGFVSGFLLTILLVPGSFAAFLNRIRR